MPILNLCLLLVLSLLFYHCQPFSSVSFQPTVYVCLLSVISSFFLLLYFWHFCSFLSSYAYIVFLSFLYLNSFIHFYSPFYFTFTCFFCFLSASFFRVGNLLFGSSHCCSKSLILKSDHERFAIKKRAKLRLAQKKSSPQFRSQKTSNSLEKPISEVPNLFF